jgi:hypothetical protein
MRTETATKKITASGDSLVINVTREVKRLGLDRGDDVAVTLAHAIDGLDIMAEIMANAITGLGLEAEDDDDPVIIATRGDVDLIFTSVSVCAPSGLVVAHDPTRPDYDVIGIFDKDNRPLMEYVFRITEDHD